jgi:hypothetical protein
VSHARTTRAGARPHRGTATFRPWPILELGSRPHSKGLVPGPGRYRPGNRFTLAVLLRYGRGVVVAAGIPRSATPYRPLCAATSMTPAQARALTTPASAENPAAGLGEEKQRLMEAARQGLKSACRWAAVTLADDVG